MVFYLLFDQTQNNSKWHFKEGKRAKDNESKNDYETPSAFNPQPSNEPKTTHYVTLAISKSFQFNNVTIEASFGITNHSPSFAFLLNIKICICFSFHAF